MMRGLKRKYHMRRRIRFGRRSVSLGALLVGGVIALLIGGGAVYARLGGFADDSVTAVNLQKGLVGWWKLDGNTKDASPYAHDGAIVGASTVASDRKNKADGAYNLNGSSYVTMGDVNDFGTSDASVSFWIKTTQSGTWRGPQKRGTGTPGVVAGWQISGTGNNLGNTYLSDDSGNSLHFSSIGYGIADNQWHNVTITWERASNTLKLYIDGVYKETATGTGTLASSNLTTTRHMTVGAAWDSAGSQTQYLTGSVDDVRIYNRALNTNETSLLYRQYDAQINAASGEKGLIGWWKLDGNGKDATPYQNNGVFTAGTAITDRKGNAGSAYSFNASGSKMVLTNPVGQSGLVTASVWYKRNDAASASTNWRTILGHKTANIHPLIVRISTHSLCIFDGATRDFGYTVPNDGQWHNYTVVYDSAGTAKLYVDGGFISQIATTLNLGTNPIGTIGNWYGGGYWAGDIDDVRLYNRGLSQSEISRLFASYNSQINLNSSPSSSASKGNINSGLVGYWPLNGNAKDATPYANNGTIVNGATLTADRRGRANSAYSFNGSNQYIDLGTSPTLTPSNITLSAWVRATAIGSWNGIISNMTSWGTGFGLHMGTNHRISAMVSGSYLDSSTVPLVGVWYHIVATHDAASNATVLYVNGLQENSTSHAVTYEANAKTYIGVFYTSPSLLFNGAIDDVRIYNRVLSAAEAQALYNSYQ